MAFWNGVLKLCFCEMLNLPKLDQDVLESQRTYEDLVDAPGEGRAEGLSWLDLFHLEFFNAFAFSIS